MWTSSTATPAASGGLPRRAATRGSRAAAGAACRPRRAPRRRPRQPGRAACARAAAPRARPCTARAPGVAVDGELRHVRDSRVERDDRAARAGGTPRRAKPARRASRRAPRRAGTAAPTRAGRSRPRRRAAASPAAGTMRSNQSEKNGRNAPRGRVISRIASRPPGTSTRAQLASAALEVGDVAHAEADRGGVERRVRERAARAGRPAPSSIDGDFRRARSSIRSREVEARHARRRRRAGREREVAGAAGGVEHAVAGPHDRRRREPPPAQVEPDRHHAVHDVVDWRDPVEHRADALGASVPGPIPASVPVAA